MKTSGRPAGLELAVRSKAPGGTYTTIGIFYEEYTRMPLLEMYSIGMTFRHGRTGSGSDARDLELIAAGRFDPTLVISETAGWEDAGDALSEAPLKLIVARSKST